MHTNLINGKVYIGITNNKQRRWRDNGIEYKPKHNRVSAFWNAIEKYGWNNFSHEVLLSNLTFEEACNKEKETILLKHSDSHQKGYNISPGGNGGKVYKVHPKGMLGKHQTAFQKKSHKVWALNHDNNPMTNGKVVWGVTNPHPKGMLGKHQTDYQRKIASSHKGTTAYNHRWVKAIAPNKTYKLFPSVTACVNHYKVYSIHILLKTGNVYHIKSVNTPNRSNLEKIDGYRFEYVQVEDTEITNQIAKG
ncbi:hypothetical protein N6G95_09455 [Pediococcus inopinatus]|uniref:hypothetical protein n=1 Tax=Pediococcus inopinatus TaxID=114090 RepID=UPI002B25BF3C|nr:hypothetical protein [Pediococcus inopinatus]WPC19430.1 hypothetical protein N6G95_09455 [Pediococcus inopinatus]